MAHPDEPEQPGRARERKATGAGPGRRPAQPARPAWDAATYGLPEDARRRRPAAPPKAEPIAAYLPALPSGPSTPGSSGPGSSGPGSSGPPGRSGPPDPGPHAGPPALAAPGSRPASAAGGSATTAAPRSRAGRDLPAAIAVGVGLGAVVLVSLFVWRPAFLGVMVVAVGIGVWELVRALSKTSVANPPLIPLLAGGAVMTALAWWGGADALTFGLILTVLVAMVWRLTHGFANYARDVAAATLVVVYVPLLAGFAAMLAEAPHGDLHVLVMILGVVLSDTGGYALGAGLPASYVRHPMAPSVSPSKSWEGLGGSLLAAALGCALFFWLVFDTVAWKGALFGLGISVAAVVGDLGESMVKRALGIKDMSRLLPGHGGLMDRLDSVLFAAPTAFVLLMVLLPAGH